MPDGTRDEPAAPAPAYLKSDVPEGRSGEWAVERLDQPERGPAEPPDRRPDCFRYRPGRYTRLRRGHTDFMTDLYDEWWTQRTAIAEACRRGGRVLVTGLGLGLVAESMLRTPGSAVESVTLVEASTDVIRLVAPHLRARYGERVAVVHADAFAWQPPPGSRFSVGWHDIWPSPHEARALPETERLERRFAPWCDWQGSWVREYLRAERGEPGATH